MIARVVTNRDDARLATFVTAAPAIFLLLALADDVLHLALFRAPSSAMYAFIAVGIAVAGVGPWLAWSRRSGRAVQLRLGHGMLAAGRLRIDARNVRAISVAHGARGTSVAVEHGRRVAFFEVERADDAAVIVDALGGARAVRRDVVVLPRSRGLAYVQIALSFAAFVAAPLYYVGASGWNAPDAPAMLEAKAIFGIGGVVAAALSFAFLVLRQLLPNQAVAPGAGSTWEVHATLHRERAAAGDGAGGAGDAEHGVEHAVEHVRVGNLGRGDEDVSAWLARIDALPAEQHAYRGDALAKDVLWEALGNPAAAVDTRMAAARVLRRRYGEEEGALVRVVADPDVRLRIEAALDDGDDAERRIERLGPLFRAR